MAPRPPVLVAVPGGLSSGTIYSSCPTVTEAAAEFSVATADLYARASDCDVRQPFRVGPGLVVYATPVTAAVGEEVGRAKATSTGSTQLKNVVIADVRSGDAELGRFW
jgi:hypothetical protein